MSISRPEETTGPPPPADQPPTLPRPREVSSDAATLPPSPPANDQPATLLPGRTDGPAAEHVTLPGYEILSELGRGGMGVVYKARHLGLNRLVAIKMILAGQHAGEQELARFRTEAEAVARLQHPNIVQIHDVGEQNGCPYFSLEYVEGGSLADRLDGTPQPPRQAAELITTLADAIHAAHECGIVHRDLKPANVLLSFSRELRASAEVKPALARSSQLNEGVPKLTDFGLAKRLDSQKGHTQTGSIMGTPSYMAPEQAEGKKAVGPTADVYALGAILYELLTGRPPFRAETPLDTVLQVISSEPVPPTRLQPKVPRDLETICLQCLQKDPRRRYASARLLAEDLRRFLADEPIRARPIGWWERAVKWARRRPAVAALLATVVAVTLVGLGLVLWQWQTARREKQAADVARDEAHDERRKAERLSAVVALQHGLTLCEGGDAARGMVWLAHALQIAPPDDAQLARGARLSLEAWRRQFGEAGREFHAQAGPVQVTFSPDGKLLLMASSGASTRLWNAASGAPHGEPLVHAGTVRAGAFSADGRLVLTGSDDKTASLWHTADGTAAGPPLSHEGAVLAVAFSPDGRSAVTGSADRRARVWEVATGKLLYTLSHSGPVAVVGFSPDGRKVLTASHDGTARLWDAATGQAVSSPMAHKAKVGTAAFSPDGKLVATGSEDYTARLWDAGTGQPRPVPALAHHQIVHEIAFSPDSRTLITVSRDTYARRWDTATGKLAGDPLPNNYPAVVAAFSPDGQFIATGSLEGRVRVWDAATGKPLLEPLRHPDSITSLAFARDGRTLVAGSSDGSARLWDLFPAKRGRLAHKAEGASGYFSAALSPDGRFLLVGCQDKKARVLNVATGEQVLPPMEHGDDIWSVAWPRDGQTFLTASLDRKACLWEAQAGKLRQTLAHAAPIFGAGLSPDGRFAVTGTQVGTVHLWDLQTGTGRQLPQRHRSPVFAVAFSPDGRRLLTGSLDVSLAWDTASWQVQRRFTPDGGVTAAVFRADSQRLATGGWNGAVQVWDAATFQPVGEPYRHQAIVRDIAFSPGGDLVLTASLDKTARVLDAATGRPVGPPLRHAGMVSAAGFTADGKELFTAGAEDAVQFWAVPSPMEGDVAAVVAAVREQTGLEMGDDGIIRAAGRTRP